MGCSFIVVIPKYKVISIIEGGKIKFVKHENKVI
ncbi:hypothetical protein SAMN05421544_11638 [Riemerella columbipharyngis]|uniref:Uncharacterized protein n=1 Tax=Riemerella columbipharyngis TaxID=1071918 RepID=A0A1G7EL40_9FLAO|nr:hypothetical protein SAMN05421544_11638 [Riemerella columbipharyngis]